MKNLAVVTGASSGLGKEMMQSLFFDQGSEIFRLSRNGPDISTDLSDPNQVGNAVNKLRASGKTRYLINCAGILRLDENDNNVREIFEVNFWACYQLIQGLLPDLYDTNGCVINIASVSGLRADPDTPIYGASKAALISLTKSLAIKHAPHVRFNSVSPGFFNTNLVGGPLPQELVDTIPLKREASPEELIPVVQSIIDCGYVNGANFVVDGGLSCT